MKKLTPKFINQSVALLVVIFMIWTAKGGFKKQIMSVYQKGVNNSSKFDEKVNHLADILYQYSTYIAIATMLFYFMRFSDKILSYRQKISSIFSSIVFFIFSLPHKIYRLIKKSAQPLTKERIQQIVNKINLITLFSYLFFIAGNFYLAYKQYKQSKQLLRTILMTIFRFVILFIVRPFIIQTSHFKTSSQKVALFWKQIQELFIFGGIYIYLLNNASSKLKDFQIILFPSWIILTFWLRYFSELSRNQELVSLFLYKLSFYLKLFTFGIMILQCSGESVFRYI